MRVVFFIFLIFLLPNLALAEQTIFEQYAEDQKQYEKMREQILQDSKKVHVCLKDVQEKNKNETNYWVVIHGVRECLVSYIIKSFSDTCKDQERFAEMGKIDQMRLREKKDKQIVAVSDGIVQVRVETELGGQTIMLETFNDDFLDAVKYIIPYTAFSGAAGAIGGGVFGTAGKIIGKGVSAVKKGRALRKGKQGANSGVNAGSQMARNTVVQGGLKGVSQGGLKAASISGGKSGLVFGAGISGFEAVARPITRQGERDAYLRAFGHKIDGYPHNELDDDYPVDICDIEKAWAGDIGNTTM